MMPTQLVKVVTEAGSHTAYARAGGREHQATSTSPELAVRLAAAGVHRVQLIDVASAERLRDGMWRVIFRHGSVSSDENWAHVPAAQQGGTGHGSNLNPAAR